MIERSFEDFVSQKKKSIAAACQAGGEIEEQSDSDEEEEEVKRFIGGSAVRSGGEGVCPSQADMDNQLVERKRKHLLDKMNLL